MGLVVTVDGSSEISDSFLVKILFFISLCKFNQLDATSKVMYRHEIICTGNKAYFINKYLFRDNASAGAAAFIDVSRTMKQCSQKITFYVVRAGRWHMCYR